MKGEKRSFCINSSIYLGMYFIVWFLCSGASFRENCSSKVRFILVHHQEINKHCTTHTGFSQKETARGRELQVILIII